MRIESHIAEIPPGHVGCLAHYTAAWLAKKPLESVLF